VLLSLVLVRVSDVSSESVSLRFWLALNIAEEGVSNEGEGERERKKR
jgi:hypothetical protein